MRVPLTGRRECEQPQRLGRDFCGHIKLQCLVALALCIWICGSSAFAGTKVPAPVAQVDLESIGFPGFSQAFLDAGGSMLTVHFVDSKHLLVTYATRGLVRRIPDDQEDESRLVAAKLVELPSGKVLAQTEWRLHDQGRYLWNLGEGRFLLRDRNALSTFAPLTNLQDANPFERTFLEHREGNIRLIAVSADFKVLTIETEVRLPAKSTRRGAKAAFVPAAPDGDDDHKEASLQRPVSIEFLRYSGSGLAAVPLSFEKAGGVGSPHAVLLPVDSDGYLQAEGPDLGSNWTIHYHPFDGKQILLAPIDSSCLPELWNAARGFALAVTCRGSTGRVKLFGLDFGKHELWEEPYAAPSLSFTFAFAPASRRFALSFTQSASGSLTAGAPDSTATQEVLVYQAQTGDVLLKVDCLPVFRTEENFDLSGDGTRLAVVRPGAIAIYSLRNLTASDRADFAEMEKFTPPAASGAIELTALEVANEVPAAPIAGATEEKRKQAGSVAAATATQEPNGDDQSPRKPPTLLNPGEKPEH